MNLLEEYQSKEKEILEDLTDESLDLDIKEEEEVESPISDNNRKLYIDKVDKSTSDLFRMIKENEIHLQPSFQRKFVWNEKIMSKFIESLLLAIPIPTIFLAENNDNSYDVIDGQQRLTTIFSYMKSGISADEKENLSSYLKELDVLKLKQLEALNKLNGLTFEQLDKDIRRKFNNVSLPIVIVQKDSTEDIKFDIFSRINQGSVKLNQQELRNVMYRGVLMDKINTLAQQDSIKKVFGNRPILEKRFGLQETILRAIVMERFINFDTWELMSNPENINYGGRLNGAIISYLKENKNNSAEADRIEKLVNKMFGNVYEVFGSSSFMRYTSEHENKYITSLNKTVAELQLVVLSTFDTDSIKDYKSSIHESFKNYSLDNEDLFTKATNNTSNVIKRYSWGKSISEELLNKWATLLLKR